MFIPKLGDDNRMMLPSRGRCKCVLVSIVLSNFARFSLDSRVNLSQTLDLSIYYIDIKPCHFFYT
jgi:hypothetical protein